MERMGISQEVKKSLECGTGDGRLSFLGGISWYLYT
jgi:hypothetical protein